MATKLLPRYTKPLTSSFRPSISSLTSIHTFNPSNRPTRQYHSADHPSPPGPFNTFESKILEKAIVHVPSHGFTVTSLGLGAKECGLVEASVNAFERGAWSLVWWHFWSERVGLKGVLGKDGEKIEGWEGMSEAERVREVCWRRLLGNKRVIGRWQEALALSAIPSNIPPTLKELYLLSDEILYLSGSMSVDFSWYTKRVSLSTIYAATELFMTTDKSEGFKETKEFMERRFSESESLKEGVGAFGQWVGMELGSVVGVLRSKGVRI